MKSFEATRVILNAYIHIKSYEKISIVFIVTIKLFNIQ
jgi:hypothetical protein